MQPTILFLGEGKTKHKSVKKNLSQSSSCCQKMFYSVEPTVKNSDTQFTKKNTRKKNYETIKSVVKG